MRGLLAALCLVGQSVAAETCAALGGTGLFLTIEEAHEVVDHGKGVTIILEPEGRSPRVIGIQPADGVEPLGGVVLANGMTLDYETTTEEAVGGGGAVAGLVGALSARSVFGVVCLMQSEVPEAEWCLPYLGRLRTDAEACPEEK